jgi:Sulfotransferase family
MTTSAERDRSPAPYASAGRMPDFFVAGHAKCGTTALYEMLRSHPQIFMPELKEPVYFATDLRARFQHPASGPVPTEPEDYMRLFEPAAPGQLTGEASSSYLWSHEAAANIAEVAPRAKIIGILREPASFLRSLHLQLLQNHIESEKDLRKALALEPLRRQGKKIPRRSNRPQALLYSERVRYVEQLRRYEAVFPPAQILILIYDEFRRENEATLQRVLRFLEVDDSVEVAPSEANPTVLMRSQQLDEMVHRVSVGRGAASRAVKAGVKAMTPEKLRREALRAAQRRLLVAPAPKPDEPLMAELRRQYRPEVEALGEHLGRDLIALWGYDDVD